jgi:hypothetical protein
LEERVEVVLIPNLIQCFLLVLWHLDMCHWLEPLVSWIRVMVRMVSVTFLTPLLSFTWAEENETIL